MTFSAFNPILRRSFGVALLTLLHITPVFAAGGPPSPSSPQIVIASRLDYGMPLQLEPRSLDAPPSSMMLIALAIDPSNERRGNVRPKKVSPALLALGGLLLLTDKETQRILDADMKDEDREDQFAHNLAMIAEPHLLAIPGAALYLMGGEHRQAALDTATAIADASLVTVAGKWIAGKKRPWQTDGTPRYNGFGEGRSFPSGHSAVAWAAATVMGDHYPKYKFVFYLLAAGVGWARIDESKHYLSDVAAGAAVGVASGRRVLKTGHGFFQFEF